MRKKSCQPNSHIKNVEISNPSQPNGKSEEVGMKLDMRKGKEKESAKSDEVLDSTGGNDTDRVNGCVAVLEAPDSDPASSCSVPAASSLGGYCHHDSAKNSSSILGHTIPLVALSYVLINVHYLVKLFTTPLFYRFFMPAC
jgi:hypothetical protein